MNDIKIEKGIPIPPTEKGTGVTAALRKMKVGESFTAPLKWRPSITACARSAAVKIVTRKVSDDELRVWRTG